MQLFSRNSSAVADTLILPVGRENKNHNLKKIMI
jgi:hypothetical protein